MTLPQGFFRLEKIRVETCFCFPLKAMTVMQSTSGTKSGFLQNALERDCSEFLAISTNSLLLSMRLRAHSMSRSFTPGCPIPERNALVKWDFGWFCGLHGDRSTVLDRSARVGLWDVGLVKWCVDAGCDLSGIFGLGRSGRVMASWWLPSCALLAAASQSMLSPVENGGAGVEESRMKMTAHMCAVR